MGQQVTDPPVGIIAISRGGCLGEVLISLRAKKTSRRDHADQSQQQRDPSTQGQTEWRLALRVSASSMAIDFSPHHLGVTGPLTSDGPRLPPTIIVPGSGSMQGEPSWSYLQRSGVGVRRCLRLRDRLASNLHRLFGSCDTLFQSEIATCPRRVDSVRPLSRACFPPACSRSLKLRSSSASKQARRQCPAMPSSLLKPRTLSRQTRPEQQKTAHDQSDAFSAAKARPKSAAFQAQPEKGQILGFDFYRDPLNAKRPMETFEENMKADIAAKAGVMEVQRRLLEQRYNLAPVLDPQAKMSRGKPLCVGPTARLAQGVTWESLSAMSAEEIRRAGTFPYHSLPHPKQTPGGQVFPKMQIEMFPRLERFDIDFDLPEAFLPEFPPAIFLQTRPELGDVSRGEVVSINNYYRLFKDILTPVQLDGLRLLLTPFPQEEFNPTDDRKSANPSLGVTCLDCHVNGHTTGQFHLNPDNRPRAAPDAAGHGQPARRVQPADSRLEAQPAIGGRLHRVRAADGLLQRR